MPETGSKLRRLVRGFSMGAALWGSFGLYITLTPIESNASEATAQQMDTQQTVRKLSLEVEKSPNAIFITDPQGIIEYINPAFTQTTGYNWEEAIGATPGLLKSGQTPVSTYADLWHSLKDGHSWSGELYNRKKSG